MQKLKRKKKINKTARKVKPEVIKLKVRTQTRKTKSKTIKVEVKVRNRKERKENLIKRPLLKIAVLMLIIGLNWTGLSLVINNTFAYFNDTETSSNGIYSTGSLDFYLISQIDFSPLTPGESTTQTISIINNGNSPRYIVEAVDFGGGLCNYLNLEANLDGEGSEYNGNLIGFDYGPIFFAEPEDWVFTLTLTPEAPENLLGETCQFKFIFSGSQIRNNLPFGQGFSDIEEEGNNIEAKICFDAEGRSKGYWKNHSEVFETYLPQVLGNGIINTTEEAGWIFENSDSMRNKLKGQLLAMKFNIAHFRIGDYFVESEGKTLNQITAEADDLLKQVPEPSQEILEAMKNLLDDLNNDLGQFRHCTIKEVKVLVPNGKEIWWIGRTYNLTWTTQNLDCSGDSIIDIWYSGDSGYTFANIVQGTENDGVYEWNIRLYLGFTYFVPSDQARIKVIARCADDLSVAGWDMSDEDFCPPIDYDLLRPEEIQVLVDLGYIEDPNIGAFPQLLGESPEEPTEEVEEMPEETSTSTETEIIPTEETSTSTEELIEEELPVEEESTSTEEEVPLTEENSTSSEEIPEEEPVEEATSTEEIPEEPADEPAEEEPLLENKTTTSEVVPEEQPEEAAEPQEEPQEEIQEEPVNPATPPEEPEKSEEPIEPEKEPAEPTEPTEPENTEESVEPAEDEPIPES